MSGLGKLGAYGATTAMIGAVGLPFPPLAFAAAVAVELGGGLLLVAGYRTRTVASVLALFSLATAVAFSQQFRRPEPDDPLPQERDDGRRPLADRGLRRRCAQHRQSPRGPARWARPPQWPPEPATAFCLMGPPPASQPERVERARAALDTQPEENLCPRPYRPCCCAISTTCSVRSTPFVDARRSTRSSTRTPCSTTPTTASLRGRDEIDRIAGVIKATHPDFQYRPIAPPEETGDGGRVRWVSGNPGQPPAYAGTDFIIARDGRIAALYLFFDELA